MYISRNREEESRSDKVRHRDINNSQDKCRFLSDSFSCRSGSLCKQLQIHVHLKYNHGMQGQGDTMFYSRAIKKIAWNTQLVIHCIYIIAKFDCHKPIFQWFCLLTNNMTTMTMMTTTTTTTMMMVVVSLENNRGICILNLYSTSENKTRLVTPHFFSFHRTLKNQFK